MGSAFLLRRGLLRRGSAQFGLGDRATDQATARRAGRDDDGGIEDVMDLFRGHDFPDVRTCPLEPVALGGCRHGK